MRPKMAKMRPKTAKMKPKMGKMTPIEKTLKKEIKKAPRCVCMHARARVATLIEVTARRRQDDGETKKKGRLSRRGLPGGVRGRYKQTTIPTPTTPMAKGLANFYLLFVFCFLIF